MNVAVLGASPKPERYSNKAMHLLQEHGHRVVPVNPQYDVIDGLDVVDNLKKLPAGSIDTVTVYVREEHSQAQASALLELKPRRVIFNPGSENEALAEVLRAQGIAVENACTLVLLRTGQFA